jgi:hypothetical protein
MAQVSPQTYPNLHAAFRAIEENNGGHLIGTVYPGERINLDSFTVPAAWDKLLPVAEAGLARLCDTEDFSTFVCGEASDVEAIRVRQGDLDVAQRVLNDYFSGWPTEDAPKEPG